MAGNSLQAVLDQQARLAASAEPPASQPAPPAPSRRGPGRSKAEIPASAGRPSREGKRLIAGHFDPKVARQLRLLAAEDDTTIQALLEEALDLLFVKKGRPAARKPRGPEM